MIDILTIKDNLISVSRQISNIDDIVVLEQLLVEILNYDHRKLGEFEVTEVKIKTKKKSKYFNKIFPGQIFEIFLDSVGRFTYCVVLEGNYIENKNSDIIIAYLKVFVDEPLSIEQINKLIEKREFVFIANSSIASIRDYRWKSVCTYRNEIMTKKEIAQIPFASSFMGKYYRSYGNSIMEIAECEQISSEEFNLIPNLLGIAGDLSIENRLIEYYKQMI